MLGIKTVALRKAKNSIPVALRKAKNSMEFLAFLSAIGSVGRHEKMEFGDNSEILFLFLSENICCDPSLELSG